MMYPITLPLPKVRRRVLVCGPELNPSLDGFTIDARALTLEERNDTLRKRLGDTRLEQLNLIVEAPRTAERAFWAHVLQAEAHLVLPSIEGHPLDWWGPYDMDRRAEEAMRRRGWTG